MELMSLGYPPSRIERAYEIYQSTRSHTHKDNCKVDRDAIMEILIEFPHIDDEAILSKQEHLRQCLVHGFIRQFEADRLQIPLVINQMCIPFYGSSFVNATALSLDEVLSLSVGDQLDHRDFAGLFASATVMQIEGTRMHLHYDDWTSKWDRWSDGTEELFRFARHESVSKREAHRLTNLEEGDYVDINPIHTRRKYKHRHSGWKHAEIKQVCDGQIKVSYKVKANPDKTYLYWVHLDNVDEVAAFTSKAGSVQLDVLDHYPLDSFHDDEDIYSDSTTKVQLTEIFGTDEHALHCCMAKAVFGGSSRKYVDTVKRRCQEWVQHNQAAMKRARSMAKYMGCGGRSSESDLHLAVMVLADALDVRIKVYTFDDHISPNNDELVTLWADYSGSMVPEEDCTLVCLARLRNAFGLLRQTDDEMEIDVDHDGESQEGVDEDAENQMDVDEATTTEAAVLS